MLGCLRGEGASRAPPLSPSLSFYELWDWLRGGLRRNLNSGPDNRPVLGRQLGSILMEKTAWS